MYRGAPQSLEEANGERRIEISDLALSPDGRRVSFQAVDPDIEIPASWSKDSLHNSPSGRLVADLPDRLPEKSGSDRWPLRSLTATSSDEVSGDAECRTKLG